MILPRFETEHFFARYEFSAPYLLSASDCETVSISELLELAGGSLEELGQLELGYTDTQGHEPLRQAIASSYQNANSEEVIGLATPVEGIYLTMRTLLEKDDKVIVLTPAYDALYQLPAHIGGKLQVWRLTPTTTGWTLDFEHLEKLITSKTKLLVVNFPHNPTGFLPTEAEFDSIVQFAKQHDLWLFSDEMYRGLEFGERPRLPSASERYSKSIVLSGLSKTHGLPGLRAGWLVVKHRELRHSLINTKMYTSICSSAPSERLSLVALSVTEKLAEKNRNIVRQNLAIAESFFERWSELFTWRPPLAGSVALVEMKREKEATSYCHDLAQRVGIVLLPSAFLGYPDRFVRFTCGRTSFEEALEAYDSFLQKQ